MADLINVKTDALRTMADEVSVELTAISGEFDSMISVINGTNAYWQGDAADAFRAKLNGKRDKMNSFLKRLNEYISDLGAISQVYETVEKQAQDLSAALETDVIY